MELAGSCFRRCTTARVVELHEHFVRLGDAPRPRYLYINLDSFHPEAGMHKLLVLYPPQPDPEAFKAYYRNTHVPLVRKMPGLLSLRYSFGIHAIGGDPPYFCVFEADFPDAATAAAALGSPEGVAAAADVPNFAKAPPTLLHYTVES